MRQLQDDQMYRDWQYHMPAIPFNPAWEVRILPPFGGAMVRFTAKANGRSVSVYLDVDESLGFFTGDGDEFVPYWEIYPYGDDVFRCQFNDIDGLVGAINESLGLAGK